MSKTRAKPPQPPTRSYYGVRNEFNDVLQQFEQAASLLNAQVESILDIPNDPERLHIPDAVRALLRKASDAFKRAAYGDASQSVGATGAAGGTDK